MTLKNNIQKISQDALRYAQELEIYDIKHLALKLYYYNRQPLSPYLYNRFNSSIKVLEYLHVDEYGQNYEIINKNWKKLRISGEFGNAWVSFKNMNQSRNDIKSNTYKLYLSTTINSLQKIIGEVFVILSDSGIFVKIWEKNR